MEELTYQEEQQKEQMLETYEWDNVWWEHASDTEKKRVLLVGDSITVGYRAQLNKTLDGEIYVDSFASSKSIDNPFLKPSIVSMIAQKRPALMILNNGLHGFHLDTEDYEKHYRATVKLLREDYADIKLALTLTTPSRVPSDLTKLNDGQNEIICARNAAARRIADEYGLDVIDLYELLIHEDYTLWSDTVHLKPEGYDKLTHAVADYIKKNI